MTTPKLRAVSRGRWQKFYDINTGNHYVRLTEAQWFRFSSSGNYQRVLVDAAKELEAEYKDCLPQLRRYDD